MGNPPFIGAATMRRALGDGYVDAVRRTWPEVPESADFVMYWWHIAGETVRAGEASRFGFISSDSYPGRGAFMRCAPEGGHHDLFLLQLPTGKRGINHVAFTVRDIHEVFGGGLHFSRCGWETQLGPGRHPVSSAYFWYFKNPAGGLIEYYADEDQLTGDWQPRAISTRSATTALAVGPAPAPRP